MYSKKRGPSRFSDDAVQEQAAKVMSQGDDGGRGAAAGVVGGAATSAPVQHEITSTPTKRKSRIFRQKSKLQTVRLFQGLGTHYADLWCGTSEPQRQTVIVDTGSSSTAFPCSQCQNCGTGFHVDAPFVQELSPSFQQVKCPDCSLGTCEGGECRFGVSYLEGSSWTALEATDRCYLGGFHNEAVRPTTTGAFHSWFTNGRDPHSAPDFAFDLRFGCQTKIQGSSFTQQMADGIMGMNNSPFAVWDQMYAQSKISARAFSLCFQRVTETRRSGTESGLMTIGGTDSKLHSQVMAFTSLESGLFFSVQLRKMYLRQAGDSSAISITVPSTLHEPGRKHVIIDSGTTDTYFTQEMQAEFYKAWLAMVGTDFTNEPVSLSPEKLAALPSLVLQFHALDGNQNIDDPNNATMAGELDPEYPFDLVVVIPPSHYMEYHPDQSGYVAGLFWDEPEGIVLGANTMMGHDILFDVENARLGWAESSCNYTIIAEGDTPSVNKLYASPSLRFRQPQGRPPQARALDDRILLLASFVMVVAAVFFGAILFLTRRIRWKSAGGNTSRLSASMSVLTHGREIRRSISRMASRDLQRSTSRTVKRDIQRSNSKSTQRASSEMVVQRQTRRNESRSILHAVQESHETNQVLQMQPPDQFTTRISSERTALLRSRSQQVERDRSFISTI